MAFTVRSTNLPSIDTPLVDPATGEMTVPWFNFMLALFNRTGAVPGSKGNGAGFLFPTGNGNSGQLLTSQGANPTIWTDPITKTSQLNNDAGFVTSGGLGSVPAISIVTGNVEGGFEINNNYVSFYGQVDFPPAFTSDGTGGQIPQIQDLTVTLPIAVSRILDVTINCIRDTSQQFEAGGYPPGPFCPVHSYQDRTDGINNRFSFLTISGGTFAFRGAARK